MLLDRWIASEGRRSDASCRRCGQSGDWWCVTCLGSPTFCQPCLSSAHCYLPLHKVEEWTGDFYKQRWLWSAGLVLHLGHGGDKCPNTFLPDHHVKGEEIDGESDAGQPDDEMDEPEILQVDPPAPKTCNATGDPYLTVVDTSGVHAIAFRWCQCANGASCDCQLFDLRFFPASFNNPKTVFTFNVLDEFYASNLECKTSARSFYSKLQRRTSPTFPQSVPVRAMSTKRYPS